MIYPVRCLFVLALLSVGQLADGQEFRAVPLESKITQVQPMTGIVLWSDNSGSAEHSDAITLEYRYCGYNEVVKPDGEYDFSKLDEALDEIASRNHQAVLRFHFCHVGPKRITIQCDAMLPTQIIQFNADL